MKNLALVLLLSIAPVAGAQTADEQLLSAQMAYQQGDAQLSQASGREKQAEQDKAMADARLLDAQAAVQKSAADLATAKSALDSAKQQMEQLSQALREAWKRKDGE
jgi:chromosome segregation ATPase